MLPLLFILSEPYKFFHDEKICKQGSLIFFPLVLQAGGEVPGTLRAAAPAGPPVQPELRRGRAVSRRGRLRHGGGGRGHHHGAARQQHGMGRVPGAVQPMRVVGGGGR